MNKDVSRAACLGVIFVYNRANDGPAGFWDLRGQVLLIFIATVLGQWKLVVIL